MRDILDSSRFEIQIDALIDVRLTQCLSEKRMRLNFIFSITHCRPQSSFRQCHFRRFKCCI